MLHMEAAEKAKGIKQMEEGYKRNYMTALEEYKSFLMDKLVSVHLFNFS